MSKWYLAVRVAAKWHLLAAGARMGLAIALAQYIHAVFVQWEDFQGILSPFFYASHDMLNVNVKVAPQEITMVISLLALCAFALAETGLLVALTQLVHTFFKRQTIKAALGTVLLRALLVVILAGSMFAFRSAYKSIEAGYASDNNYRAQAEFRQSLPALKLVHRPLFALLDNGTMLATEIMRPVGRDSWFACTGRITFSDPPSGTYCKEFDNRPHVLTWLGLSAVGLLLYAGLTWLFLRITTRRTVLSAGEI